MIIEKDFDTFGITLLASLAWLGIIITCLAGISVILFLVALLIFWSVEAPSRTGGIVALIVGVLSVVGVIYSTNKKRNDEQHDRFDNSIYIIIQYLIELKRGNYNYKIFKDDLSYIFMNVPNNVLLILRDIQDNIKLLKNAKAEEKEVCEKVINKEILFLIVYIREVYHIANAELKYDVEHEEIINDLIVNSSKFKSKEKTNLKTNQKKSSKK